jgi:hypothetical protein
MAKVRARWKFFVSNNSTGPNRQIRASSFSIGGEAREEYGTIPDRRAARSLSQSAQDQNRKNRTAEKGVSLELTSLRKGSVA